MSTEIKFRGKVIDIAWEKYVNKTYEAIIHPGAAAVVAYFTKSEEIILVKQYRTVVKKSLLEIPAGRLEKHEPPNVCAQRELLEETGYTANNINPLGYFFPTPGISTEIIHLFYTLDPILNSNYTIDYDEIEEVIKVKIDKSIEMILNGDITDSKTIIGILKFFFKIKGT